MATVAQIYESMANAANQQTALTAISPNPDSAAQLQTDLTSGSRVSPWRRLMWVVAYVTKLQQDLFERFKVETADLSKDGHFGTRRWFVAKALKFQFGHALVFTDLDATYAVNDPLARIVTHAAVVEMANVVVVKVAKKAIGSGLIKLAPAELVAVNDYFQELRPPVQVTVLTADPDLLRIFGAVVFDGQLPLVAVQSAVVFVVNLYFQKLAFGGVVRVSDIEAAMLKVGGVVDVRIDRLEVRTTGLWSNVPRAHYTYAGHAALDAGSPMTSTMQWQVGNF